MKKLGLIVVLLILSSFFFDVIGCAKTSTTPTIPTAPTPPNTPSTPATSTREQPFKPIKLKYGDYRTHAPTFIDPIAKAAVWLKPVEAVTNGRIVIEDYPNGSLLNYPLSEAQVGAGIAELGFNGRLQKGILPLMDLFKLPPLPGETTAMELLMIRWFALHDYLKKDFEKMNVVDLAPLTLHPSLIVTAKKPVRTMTDIKGLTLMSTDANTIRVLSDLGAVVVPIPTLDGYEALQKGMADGGVWNWEGPFLFGWIDAFKPGYFVDVGGVVRSGHTSNILMNKQAYENLPPDLRDTFEYLTWRWAAVYFSAQLDGNVPPTMKQAEKRGVQYIVWSDEEKAKFNKAKEKLNGAWIEEMEKLYKRGAEAAELVRLYGEAHARYVPPAPVPLQVIGEGWNTVYGPGSNWGMGYKAYPNQTGLRKLEGNEFKPWK